MLQLPTPGPLAVDSISLRMLAGVAHSSMQELINLLAAGAYTPNTYAPTITATSGTFTTVSASGAYIEMGRGVWVSVLITITDAGTAVGSMIVPLPTTPDFASVLAGFQNQNFYTCNATISSGIANAFCRKYDGTTIIASNKTVTLSGWYRQA